MMPKSTDVVAQPIIEFDKVDGNTRRATGSGAEPFWYLKREKDLLSVTNEATNPALGITKIHIWQPTEGQKKAGILCKITMETLSAKVDNISIKSSQFTPGDIYLQMGGRNIAGDNEEAKWVRDCKLTTQAKAQILSYVHNFLKK